MVVIVVVVVGGGVCRLGDNLRFLLSELPSSSFEMRSVIGTDLTKLPDYFSSEPQAFVLLSPSLQHWGYKCAPLYPDFYVGSGGHLKSFHFSRKQIY